MVLYGKFLELHNLYSGVPLLLRADLITAVEVDPYGDGDDAVNVWYNGIEKYFVVEEDYETVRGLLGQVYGKKG